MKLYLSLGSNLGDRQKNLELAVDKLDAVLGTHLKLSSIMETPSWGFEGNDFLNCAVSYETEKDAYEVLELCKRIEVEMGRKENLEHDKDGKRIYHDRIMDIDILLYGDLSIHSPELTVPHPLMKERDFVMLPLMEIIN